MRALLVSYAEMGVNSTAHVLAFARGLSELGWDTSVAVLASLEPEGGFEFYRIDANGRTELETVDVYDVVHLWTPRGACWHFLERHADAVRGRLLVHLEDDEGEVLRAISNGRQSWYEWVGLQEFRRRGWTHLAHPVLGRVLLACCDAATILSPLLAQDLPATTLRSWVRAPLSRFSSSGSPGSGRAEPQPARIVFAGGLHAAVAGDFLALCEATQLLSERGWKVELVRTGPQAVPPDLLKQFIELTAGSFQDLGFLPDAALDHLLATATVLVQPGRPTSFNLKRFPAKLGPYLASGTPVVMPACYAWLGVEKDVHVSTFEQGEPRDIADAIEGVLRNPEMARARAVRAALWARQTLTPRACASTLSDLYHQALNRPERIRWRYLRNPIHNLCGWLAADRCLSTQVARDALLRAAREALVRPRCPSSGRLGEPLISVIVPAFNHEKFIDERLASIGRQTYRNLEVILLDDASTDGTRLSLEKAELPFPTQRIFNPANSGSPFRQWQLGLERASGEFVWVAESDDSCAPELVRRLVDAIAWAPEIGMVYAQSILIGPHGDRLGTGLDVSDAVDREHWRKDYINTGTDEISRYLVVQNTIPNVSGCLFRRDALMDCDLGHMPFRLCGDWMAYVRILRRWNIAFVSETLNHFRCHTSSVRDGMAKSGTLLVERYQIQREVFRTTELTFVQKEAAARATFKLVERAVREGKDLGLLGRADVATCIREVDPRFRARLEAYVGARGNPGVLTLGNSIPVTPHSWRWTWIGESCFPTTLRLSGPQCIDLRVRNLVPAEEVGQPPGFRATALDGATVIPGDSTSTLVSVAERGGVELSGAESEQSLSFYVRRSAVPDEPAFGQMPDTRLLFVVPHLELGGADRFNLDLIDQLAVRFGYSVTVVTTRDALDAWQEEFAKRPIRLVRLASFLSPEDYVPYIEELILEFGPDAVLVSHSSVGYGILRWLRARFAHVALIDLVHIVMPQWRQGGYPRLSVESSAWLDATLATSQDLKGWMTRGGRDAESVHVCYTNVDPTNWSRTTERAIMARRRIRLDPDVPVLLFAGRLCDQKQPRVLPDIVATLVRSELSFVLVVAGEGPDEAWLRKHLFSRFPIHTRFIGQVSPADMRTLLAGVDILLLPSRQEGIALSLFEAMSMEVVPVATAVGGQRELLSPDCGFLINLGPNLVPDICAAVSLLLLDRGRLRSMGRSGRKRVEQFFRSEAMGLTVHNVIRSSVAARQRMDSPPVDAAEAVKVRTAAIQLCRLEATADSKNQADPRKAMQSFPSWASRSAALARRLPFVKGLARFVERRFGDCLGRWIMRLNR